MAHLDTDILVIGAGPSGAIASAIAHRAGYKVQVVEREQFPRFVIGESLLPRCMEHLQAAGLMEAAQRAGFQQKYGARFVRDGVSSIFRFGEQFSTGWDYTWQVPRADFDKVLIDEVASWGVPVHYQHSVTAVAFDGTNSTTTVTDAAGNTRHIRARFLIDASGYGRVLPKLLDLDKPSVLPPRTAHFAHFVDTNRPLNGDEHRITYLFQGKEEVFCWVIPFSNGITSVGFSGNPNFYNAFPGEGEAKLRAMIAQQPYIAERFAGAEMVFAPRTITGFAIGVKQFYGPGYALTGNSTEFLDPIFSSGVTLAMESGTLAAQLACRQLAGDIVDWEQDYSQHIRGALDVFRSFVQAFYSGKLLDVFFAPVFNNQFRQQICSVLAGYVWDKQNPFVSKTDRALAALIAVVGSETAVAARPAAEPVAVA